MAVAASISSKEQLQHLIDQTRAAWGSIDILVCNAATNPYYGPTTGMSDEVFDKIMRNNVLSNAWLCNLAYPDMKAKRNGAIVIVSMQNYLASLGAWVTVVQGVIFVICVMTFREGIVGVISKWIRKPL